MEFSQYKANAMKKLDYAKSEGLVDEGVIEVLNAFNSHPDIFTTSSCAGRSVSYTHLTLPTIYSV